MRNAAVDRRARAHYHRGRFERGSIGIPGGEMGRGDARTRKGKIFKGSHGKSRPKKVKKKATVRKTGSR